MVIPVGAAEQIPVAVEALGIALDMTSAIAVSFELARGHRLPVQDSLDLELALRRRATLACLDAALLAAAGVEAGVAVEG